jgi:hypothetical protein
MTSDDDSDQGKEPVMDLVELLDINPNALPSSTDEAVADSETQWRSAGKPSAPGPLEEFLDSQLRRCTRCGLHYPKVFLLRLKQLQRGE